MTYETPITSAPNIPQMAGPGPAAKTGGGGGLGALLGGFLGGGAIGGLSFSDQSTIAPTVAPNQSGGTNSVQVNAGKTIFPFTNQGDGAASPLLIVAVLAVFGLLAWLILRK